MDEQEKKRIEELAKSDYFAFVVERQSKLATEQAAKRYGTIVVLLATTTAAFLGVNWWTLVESVNGVRTKTAELSEKQARAEESLRALDKQSGELEVLVAKRGVDLHQLSDEHTRLTADLSRDATSVSSLGEGVKRLTADSEGVADRLEKLKGAIYNTADEVLAVSKLRNEAGTELLKVKAERERLAQADPVSVGEDLATIKRQIPALWLAAASRTVIVEASEESAARQASVSELRLPHGEGVLRFSILYSSKEKRAELTVRGGEKEERLKNIAVGDRVSARVGQHDYEVLVSLVKPTFVILQVSLDHYVEAPR